MPTRAQIKAATGGAGHEGIPRWAGWMWLNHAVPGLADQDLQRIRDQLFFEGAERGRRLSRFWSLLLLAAVIATAGVMADSTATVIGAMIVAPLMTPILGIVFSVVLTDGANLRRSLLLVVSGAASVVAIGWTMGLFVPYVVVAATNSQVAARVSPTLIDLVAALATGAVGAVALARSDISDTLPGVAIAISLVPPLSVVGLTLESGAPEQAVGALLLFVTNVSAILVSGVFVMAIYRVPRLSDRISAPTFHRRNAVAVIITLVLLITVPLAVNSRHVNRTAGVETEVRAVAERWADGAGWSVVTVNSRHSVVLVQATGPVPAPDPAALRRSLNTSGLSRVQVRVDLIPGDFVLLPAG